MLHSKISMKSRPYVVFQIWSWYHNNCGSCEILFGHYTKNTPKLYFSDVVFCHKSKIFGHNITSNTKQLPNMEPWLSDLSNDMCFDKITKRFDFLKHKPQNHRVFIYVFISWFIPLKGRRIPWDQGRIYLYLWHRQRTIFGQNWPMFLPLESLPKVQYTSQITPGHDRFVYVSCFISLFNKYKRVFDLCVCV